MSPTAHTSVILAAGNGSRMGGEMPKALLNIGGRTLLKVQVSKIKDSSSRIVVVCGFQASKLYRLGLNYQLNHLWPYSNTLVSLSFGLRDVEGPFCIINGDVLFTQKSWDDLMNTSGNALMIVDCSPEDREAWQVTPTGMARGAGTGLEYVGIAKVDNYSSFRAIMDDYLSSGEHWRSCYDVVLSEMMEEGFKFSLVKGEAVEIDTPEDYERAKSLYSGWH